MQLIFVQCFRICLGTDLHGWRVKLIYRPKSPFLSAANRGKNAVKCAASIISIICFGCNYTLEVLNAFSKIVKCV